MPINYEGEMFEPVKDYLKRLSNCSESIETFGYASHMGIDEWQKDKELKYFIKFLKNRVSIGISLSPKLMQGGFINRFLTNPRFIFTEYNLKIIDDITNLKIESKNTQEFHESVLLHQNSIDFFNNLNSVKKVKRLYRKLMEN